MLKGTPGKIFVANAGALVSLYYPEVIRGGGGGGRAGLSA